MSTEITGWVVYHSGGRCAVYFPNYEAARTFAATYEGQVLSLTTQSAYTHAVERARGAKGKNEELLRLSLPKLRK